MIQNKMLKCVLVQSPLVHREAASTGWQDGSAASEGVTSARVRVSEPNWQDVSAHGDHAAQAVTVQGAYWAAAKLAKSIRRAAVRAPPNNIIFFNRKLV